MRQGEGTMHYNDDGHEDHHPDQQQQYPDQHQHKPHQQQHHPKQQQHQQPHQRHGFWNKDKLEGMVEYTKGHHTQTEFW